MNGKTSLQQMAQAAAQRFPAIFPRGRTRCIVPRNSLHDSRGKQAAAGRSLHLICSRKDCSSPLVLYLSRGEPSDRIVSIQSILFGSDDASNSLATHSHAYTYSLLLTNVQICGMVTRVVSQKPLLPFRRSRPSSTETAILTTFRINTGSVDIPDTVLISRVDKKRLTVFSDGAGGTMPKSDSCPLLAWRWKWHAVLPPTARASANISSPSRSCWRCCA